MELAVGVHNSKHDSLVRQDKWERCGDDYHRAAWWARIEGATEEGIKNFRWRGARGPKKMDGELRHASSACRMCDVGHFSHTLPPCSLPRIDLWQEFPFGWPSRVSEHSKSRVRVKYSLIPSVIRFDEYLATGHSPSMGMRLIPDNNTRRIPLPKSFR